MNYLSEVNYTLDAVERLMPLPPVDTKLDKGIELIKALSCTTVPGMISQLLETGMKTFQNTYLYSPKYRVKAIKYVANMYEVKKWSEIELQRLQIQEENSKTIQLYIDRAFQTKIDEMSKVYHLDMRRLKNEHDAAIHKINSYLEIELKNIDSYYATIIREQELKCVLYRQFLHQMHGSKVTSADLIVEASKCYMDVLKKAYDRQNAHTPSTQVVLDRFIGFIQYMGGQVQFVSFDEYIERMNRLGRIEL